MEDFDWYRSATGYTLATGDWRTPGGRSVSMVYRLETNDWNTLSASLTHDEYGLPRGMSGKALDVGGYLGSVGIALALDNPDLFVTIIEPVTENARLINWNIARNGVDNCQLYQGAVAGPKQKGDIVIRYGYDGSESGRHHAFVGGSTIVPPDDPHKTILYAEWHTLQSLSKDATVWPIDFLKIDCEGGEWGFLDDPLTSKLGVIVGEAHATPGHEGRDIVGMLPSHDVTVIPVAGDPDGRGTVEFRAVPR